MDNQPSEQNPWLWVEFCKNYADEFDVKGATVMLRSDFEARMADAQARFNQIAIASAEDDPMELDPIYVYFGTNQEVEYSDMRDYERAFTTSEMTPEEAQTLKKFLTSEIGRILWIEPSED